MNPSELREESLKIAHEARALLNEITPENEAEKQTQFDAAMAESDKLAKRATDLEKIEARETEFNAADPRRPTEDRTAKTGETPEEKRTAVFNSYLRGEASASELRRAGIEMEARAQSVGTNSAGGYLVPTELANQLVISMKAYGPLNEGGPANYLLTAGGNPFAIPTMNDTANVGALIAENTQVSTAALAFGQSTLGAYKLTSNVVLVSNELLQDSAINVQKVVSDALAERMGRIVNQLCTTGTGSSQPQGVIVGAGAGVTAASATAIAADELFNLVHSVDPAYRNNARFMMNDSTLLAIRKLKDSQNRYLWEPAYSAGDPDRIAGYAFEINQDMAAIATGAKTIAFGDFSKFWIRRVKDFTLRRLDERYADYDQVGFVGFARIDSKVVDSAAIKVLVQA
jgi:HK97 family phage major capsid protein